MKDKKKKPKPANKSTKIRKHPSVPKGAVSAFYAGENNFKALVDNAADGIMIIAAGNGKIVYANSGAVKLMGYNANKLLRTNIRDHFLTDRLTDNVKLSQRALKEITAPNRHEIAIINKSGKIIPVEITGSVFNWRRQKAVAFIIRDISKHKQQLNELAQQKSSLKEKIDNLTYYDGLTGLLNRSRFIELLNEWTHDAQKSAVNRGALLLIDIDQFKFISDTYGHGMGDDFLRRIAKLLQATLQYINVQHFNEPGKENVLCRLAADEFAVFLPYANRATGMDVAEQLRKNVERFFQPDMPSHLTVSVGVSLYHNHGDTASELLTKADIAMFRAKDLGRNKSHFYTPEDKDIEKMRSRLIWKENILEAINEDRFEVWFQPIVDLKDDVTRHYEVLARMRGMDGNIILPGPFIDIAERFGLMETIVKIIIEKAMRLHADVNKQGGHLTFCINISGKELTNEGFFHFLQSTIYKTGIDPEFLVFEITETASIGDIGMAIKILRLLKSIGCHISLDDFGVGYTSFLYLKEMHVDYLKIAGPFIGNLAHNLNDQLFVKSIVSVAKGLNIKTVAEFVEKGETIKILKEIGVDYAQGYHIGMPSPTLDHQRPAPKIIESL